MTDAVVCWINDLGCTKTACGKVRRASNIAYVPVSGYIDKVTCPSCRAVFAFTPSRYMFDRATYGESITDTLNKVMQ